MGKLKPRQIEKLTYKIQEEEPDIINHFVDVNKTVPSLYRLTGPFIFQELADLIKTKFKDFIIDWEYNDSYYRQVVFRILVSDSQVFIKNRKTFETGPNTYQMEGRKKYANKLGSYKVTTELDVFYDRDRVDIKKFMSTFDKLKLKQNTNYNKIHLICRDPEGGLYTKEYPLINNGEFSFRVPADQMYLVVIRVLLELDLVERESRQQIPSMTANPRSTHPQCHRKKPSSGGGLPRASGRRL